ncbi:MAG: HAMP domain-containing protein [Proteobacteria bacterium]|nr:HAMP domain-containing protein [Desulfocapsa sp.]MBU3944578.1 HAMP domain-containing protein [Pseudomonadota bacterium]MCG2744635.1 ATP-binding protein [Desulfobacteraceae bacterium]MBU3983196.1 HAMP domain-containing protein [Pseudomonadota bacterium]MBU4029634.1 HAMP domain-containing protein [Pseudomonadota bacterium]
MHHKRLIWQLYPSQLLITLAALLAFTWYGTSSIRSSQLNETAASLEARAHLVAGTVLGFLGHDDRAGLEDFCRQAGKASATRLTVIALDGKVLADSDEDPLRMENHNDRPEIIGAFAGKIVPSLRFSQTLQQNLMYVAIPLHNEGKRIGVLRTAIPVTAIDLALSAIYQKIVWGCLVVAVIAALVAWFIARRISKPLEQMRSGAERFARGDFAVRLREEGAEEVAILARALNEMATQLDIRIQTIVRQHSQLQAVFSSMVEGVITVDTEERILDVNQSGAQLLNVDPEKIKGKSILLAVRNTHLQNFVKNSLACASPIEGEFTSRMSADGQEKYFYAHGTRLQDRQGHIAGALIVLNDVTKLRRLESIRRDFVANVSHELKTPITSIEGFAETLLDGALDEPEDARRFVEIIGKQASRLHAIVEDLLALSRVEQEARREEIVLQELPVAEILQSAIQSCSSRVEEEDMTISLVCAEEITARINPALLEQAVVNLLDNAVKYSGKGSEIRVEAEKNANEVLIRISDNGVGIAPQDIPRIFERFYRVDKARSAKLGGTGLGLSIVKHIVAAHHGHITVESSPGKGSIFTINLPGSV